MLRVYCQDYPEDWDKGIPFVLFAIRVARYESTKFSPFELIFGHEVRGLLKLIKEKLVSELSETTLLDYVSNLRERLIRAGELAKQHLKVA